MSIVLNQKSIELIPNSETGRFQEHQLVYGHLCPNCQAPVMGLIKTEGLDAGSIGLNNYITYVKEMRKAFTFESKTIKVFGQTNGVSFKEDHHCVPGLLHFSRDKDKMYSQCRYTIAIKEQNLDRRILRCLKHIGSVFYYSNEHLAWKKWIELISNKSETIQIIDDYLRNNDSYGNPRMGISEDVCGGIPVYLLSTWSWYHNTAKNLMNSVSASLGITVDNCVVD